jgi:hypothetical protein
MEEAMATIARPCPCLWIPIVLILAALEPRQALPAGMEEFGNKAVTAVQPEWPAGILQAINLPQRVYSRWINGNEEFFFAGATEDLNVALQNFASCGSEVKEVILLPVPGETSSLVEKKPIAYDWRLQVPSGIYLAMAKREKDTSVFTHHATLTVHVTEKGIRPDRILIPAGVKVLDAADLHARYKQGLESADVQTRAQAAHLLHTLGYVEGVVDLLVTALADKEEYVRRSAAGALGLLGGRGAKALPALRQARAKEGEQVQKELDEVIAGLEAAKPPDASEDAATRKRLAEIAKLKRAGGKKPPGKKE